MSSKAAKWILNVEYENAQLSNTLDDISDVLTAVGDTLRAVSILMDKIAYLIGMGIDILENLLKAMLSILIDLIEDFLNTGIAACYHVNLKFDPDWKLSDFDTYGKGPFTGTGLDGWFYEVMVGSKNKRNPRAPKPESDQPVGLIAFTMGMDPEAMEAAAQAWTALRSVTGFSRKKSALDLVASEGGWKRFMDWADGASFFRMGSASKNAASEGKRPKSAVETKKDWARFKELTGFREEPDGSPINSWVAGWGADEKAQYPLVEASVDDDERWQKTTDLPSFFRYARSEGTWISITIGDILGTPFVKLLRQLQKLLSLITSNFKNPIVEFIQNLAKYLRELEKALDKIAKFISLIDDLLYSLTRLRLAIVPIDSANHSTGITGAIARALQAEDVPDYGSNGVVLGMCGLIQSVDIMSKIESLQLLFGLDLKKLLENYVKKWEEPFDDFMEQTEDAWDGVVGFNDRPLYADENQIFYHDEGVKIFGLVVATDADGPETLSYSIVGGKDQDLFSYDSVSGELSFKVEPDYENPTDTDEQNIYQVELQASDGGLEGLTFITIHIRNVNEGPSIKPASLRTTGNQFFPEVLTGDEAWFDATSGDTLWALFLTIKDPEGGSVTVTLTGDDANDFDITDEGAPTLTHKLSFKITPDVDSPTDGTSQEEPDNIYYVTINAADSNNNTTSYDVRISVN